jgi:kynureninase
LAIVTPREHARRGSQLCLSRAQGAHAIVQALIARGVIGDFRTPDLMRFGFAPLYNSFAEALNAAQILADILTTGEWDQPRFHARGKVT